MGQPRYRIRPGVAGGKEGQYQFELREVYLNARIDRGPEIADEVGLAINDIIGLLW